MKFVNTVTLQLIPLNLENYDIDDFVLVVESDDEDPISWEYYHGACSFPTSI